MRTVAGRGLFSSTGDNGPAAAATVKLVGGLWSDSNNNIFFAETGSNTVRKIDSSGIIRTVMGSGKKSKSGNGGGALQVSFDGVSGVSGDAEGNLYVTSSNYFIWKYDAMSEKVERYAGAVPAKLGFGGDGGAATAATLWGPSGLSVSSLGLLIFADVLNNRVRSIDGSTGIIRTIAGSGTASFSGDHGLAVLATLNQPSAVWMVDGGVVLIADTGNNRVRAIDASGMITTFAGSGSSSGGSGDFSMDPTLVSLNEPNGVMSDSLGNVYISEQGACRVRQVSVDGAIATIAGMGKCGESSPAVFQLATNTMIGEPHGVAVTSQGKVYFSEDYYIRSMYGTIPTPAPTVSVHTSSGGSSSASQSEGWSTLKIFYVVFFPVLFVLVVVIPVVVYFMWRPYRGKESNTLYSLSMVTIGERFREAKV